MPGDLRGLRDGRNDPDGILTSSTAREWRSARGMGITWDDVFAAIKYEKEFLEQRILVYGGQRL